MAVVTEKNRVQAILALLGWTVLGTLVVGAIGLGFGGFLGGIIGGLIGELIGLFVWIFDWLF